MGVRKRLKCCTIHCSGMDWVCKKSKMGESILMCGPKKQVIYREQQNVLIRSCLKSHNCVILHLYHLNPFPGLLAPADSIFSFHGNGELLDRSRQRVALCQGGPPFSQQGFGQCSQAYLHSAEHREGGKSSAVACGNGKLAKTVRSLSLIHPLTA